MPENCGVDKGTLSFTPPVYDKYKRTAGMVHYSLPHQDT